MFVCLDCGHIFEYPYCWEERHGLEYGPFEKFSGCPRCGEPYTEAHKCECCNEWIAGEYVKLNSGERICNGCYITYELGEER